MSTHLLIEIKEFLAETGMAPSYFGKKVVNNSELVSRLENGGDVRTKTANRLRVYMTERRAELAKVDGASE